MKYWFFFQNMLKPIRANIRQTILTVGSLIVGVVSVLIVLGLGNGVRESVSEQMLRITGGHNTFTVNLSKAPESVGFTKNDASRLMSLKMIDKVVLNYDSSLSTISVTNVSQSDQQPSLMTYGRATKNEVDEIEGLVTLEGLDVLAVKQGVAISKVASKKLFPNLSSPLGQLISLNNRIVTIESLYKGPQEAPDFLLSSSEFLRIGTYLPTFNQLKISFRGSKKQVENEVITYLKTYSEQGNLGELSIVDFRPVVNQIKKNASLATNLIASVAGISLVVAGFGIMSTTYSSIASRKNEIGLRRAFGATRQNIRNQFILESVLMACFASLLSILFVLALSALLGDRMGVRLIITNWNIVVAIALPMLISLLFAFIPAVSASRTNVLLLLR